MSKHVQVKTQPISKSWDKLSRLDRRSRINALEKANAEIQDVAGVQLYPKVWSAGGVYGRELFIPEGVTLVGEIHRKEQINILLEGKMIVATELEGVREITAPAMFISPAGTKRVGTALADSRWVTFLATDKTADEDVYPEFIAPSFEEFDKLTKEK